MNIQEIETRVDNKNFFIKSLYQTKLINIYQENEQNKFDLTFQGEIQRKCAAMLIYQQNLIVLDATGNLYQIQINKQNGQKEELLPITSLFQTTIFIQLIPQESLIVFQEENFKIKVLSLENLQKIIYIGTPFKQNIQKIVIQNQSVFFVYEDWVFAQTILLSQSQEKLNEKFQFTFYQENHLVKDIYVSNDQENLFIIYQQVQNKKISVFKYQKQQNLYQIDQGQNVYQSQQEVEQITVKNNLVFINDTQVLDLQTFNN